jgi:hypothetical protein
MTQTTIAPDDPDADDEHRQLQLTTLAGWRRFVYHSPDVPELLPQEKWQALTGNARESYDDTRADHHARLSVVETDSIRQAVQQGRRLTFLNRNTDYGRFGLMVDGEPRTGKTTTITQMGKAIELNHWRRHPDARHHIPVLYLTTPPTATAKMLAMEFARFLGLPVRGRANLTDVMEAVCGVLIDVRTVAVLVDEMHNVSLSTQHGADVSDTLKYFNERIPATFVYAGINITRTLAGGDRGDQIAGRFSALHTAPIPRGPQWDGLIMALEANLRLHCYRPGTLPKLADYLHGRTGGMIGSLFRLIRIASVEAVLAGSENITKKSLNDITLDIGSEREN